MEVEILTGLDSPDRGEVLVEAAQAYRSRAKCLEALGRKETALADQKRASSLEADARKLASTSLKAGEKSGGSIQVSNGWAGPVVLIAAGVTYRLEVGEQVTIPAATASVAYELRAGTYQATGILRAGKTYAIRVPTP